MRGTSAAAILKSMKTECHRGEVGSLSSAFIYQAYLLFNDRVEVLSYEIPGKKTAIHLRSRP